MLSDRPDLGELVPCSDLQAVTKVVGRIHNQYDRVDPAAIADFAEAGYGQAAQIASWKAVYENAPNR